LASHLLDLDFGEFLAHLVDKFTRKKGNQVDAVVRYSNSFFIHTSTFFPDGGK